LAQWQIDGVHFKLEGYAADLLTSTKLAKLVRELRGFIEANERFIPNDDAREATAASFVKSTC
jgi:hypothetical protein